MARLPFVKVGPLGLALTVYDVYRRLPQKQRRMVLQMTRKHGTRLATKAVIAGAAARRRRRDRP